MRAVGVVVQSLYPMDAAYSRVRACSIYCLRDHFCTFSRRVFRTHSALEEGRSRISPTVLANFLLRGGTKGFASCIPIIVSHAETRVVMRPCVARKELVFKLPFHSVRLIPRHISA